MQIRFGAGLLFFHVMNVSFAIAQEIPKRSITIGQVKLTTGLKRDDLFRQMEPQYWMQNVIPKTDVEVKPGYKLYLVYPKTRDNAIAAATISEVLSKEFPIAELAFQDDALVLAIRFWIINESDRQNFMGILGQALKSLTEDGNRECMVNPPLPPQAYSAAITRIICSNKSLDVYAAQIEERLIEP